MGEVWLGCDLDWPARQTAVFGVYDVPVTQKVLRQENGGSDVAVGGLAKQTPADRNPALRLGAIHDLAELGHFAPTNDGSSTHPKKRRDLFVRALQPTELFEFNQVDFRLRTRHVLPLLLEQPEFRAPVRERETQPLEVGVPGKDQRLDFRDLAAASFYSRGDSHPLGFDLLEGPAVAFERGLFRGEV